MQLRSIAMWWCCDSTCISATIFQQWARGFPLFLFCLFVVVGVDTKFGEIWVDWSYNIWNSSVLTLFLKSIWSLIFYISFFHNFFFSSWRFFSRLHFIWQERHLYTHPVSLCDQSKCTLVVRVCSRRLQCDIFHKGW